MRESADRSSRCGIILAAGEGKRLQPLVKQLRGDFLPKQYVNFVGRRSMLEHTFDRVEKLIPRDRVFTVVSEHHLGYPGVVRQLCHRAPGTVVVQPENKDTGPGILLPLMHVYKKHPDAAVALFPSDHFVREEERFMSHVALAFHAVERNPSLVVLLGLEPSVAEPAYGYILPNGGADRRSVELTIRRVCKFIEKPDLRLAGELIARGALWNTMVTVFKVQTLLKIVEEIQPELHGAFEAILPEIGTRNEARALRKLYGRLPSANFSKDIFEKIPSRFPACLSVLSVRGVLWSDWGLPRAIKNILKTIDSAAAARTDSVGEPRLWKTFTNRLQGSMADRAAAAAVRELKQPNAARPGAVLAGR